MLQAWLEAWACGGGESVNVGFLTFGLQNIHALLMIRRPYRPIAIEESVGRCGGADG